MLKFACIVGGVALTIVITVATRSARPEGVSDGEMLRRWLVIAALAAGCGLVSALVLAVGDRLQQWVERKSDPWRRLG